MKDVNRKSHLMYSSLPNIVIGFHGCDRDVFERVLYKHENLKYSMNSYDWLGNVFIFGSKIWRERGSGQKTVAPIQS